ncbi:MAG: ATP-binding protein [Desulfobacterales bacterium]|nr:ATP-binding protein [Desulfobacterales bacterium]
MQLKEIKFCRFKGQPNEWSIEGRPQKGVFEQWLSFDRITLITGKNASGKTKTVDAIRHIADLLSGDVQLSQLTPLGYGTAEYQLKFNDDESLIEYGLDFKDGKISQETLSVDGQVKLDRVQGKLWYEGAGKELDFETDDAVLAVSKRDKKQHSFFEKLYSWGKSLNHYRFGSQLGKNALLKDINVVRDDEHVDLKDGDEVAGIFVRGSRQFSGFIATILDDMRKISYDVKEVTTGLLRYFPISTYCLNVQENDLEDITDQREMSQGMFRALSLLIQLNYSLSERIPSCILIDDIGEGLDFDRSVSLIDLIIEKVKESSVQVIMTTNDRFVMNEVPLKYWSVIQRIPKKALFYNYQNSRKTFEEFQYTGLSNFDFLSSEFYIENFETQEEA